MENVIESYRQCTTASEVLDCMAAYFHEAGFRTIIRAVPSASNPGTMELTELGTPSQWIKAYQLSSFSHLNPVTQYAIDTGEIFLWHEIDKLTQLCEQERLLIEQMQKIGRVYGLVMPTYGSVVRAAVTVVALPEDEAAMTPDRHIVFHAVAQQAHIRLDQIARQESLKTSLSPREEQILFWIGNGKSNADIATILSLSTDTVSTYVRRLFHKLGVNDRTSAAIVGVQTGIITIAPPIQSHAA